MSLEDNSVMIARFGDELVRNMADAYFNLIGKMRSNLGGGKYLERYQNFMAAANDGARKFATYLAGRGEDLSNFNLNLIASTLTNIFFDSIVSEEDFDKYSSGTEFMTKYIDIYCRVYDEGVKFTSYLKDKGFEPYEAATRTSLDIAKNYYASMEDVRRKKLSVDLEAGRFITDSYNYLDMAYPEVVDFDINNSLLAIETKEGSPRN